MELFAIYVDILGFSSKSIGKIAQKIRLTPEEVRENWLKKINSAIDHAKDNGLIASFKEMSLDSWVFFVEKTDDVYKLLGLLSAVDLPLEIAIHFADFPNNNLTLSDQMMIFLRNNILASYKNFFKKSNKKYIEETFILVTQETHSLLKDCKKPYQDAEYYLLDLTAIPRIPIKNIRKSQITISKESEKFLSKRKNEWQEFANHNLWVISSLTPLELIKDKINPTDQFFNDVIKNITMPRHYGNINIYHSKPNENGALINEDLRMIQNGMGHRIQIFGNGYCEFLFCLEASTKHVTQYYSERDPEEYKGQKIIDYRYFSECFLKQFEGLKEIWDKTLPFNNMSLRIFIARTKHTCLFSKEGITLARSTIGDLIKSDLLEYDKIVNKTDDRNLILDIFLKKFVNLYGLHLDKVRDDNGNFISPDHFS